MELHILGTRGIPAKHGGFETFAEQLALFLVTKGHLITVYCQLGPHEVEFVDTWKGIRRIGLKENSSPLGTVRFDLRSAMLASRSPRSTVLILGYNTAIFAVIHRLRGVRSLMNMDGLEWKRQKWSVSQRLWLRINECLGLHLANAVIADHPEIKRHLARTVHHRKISIIPYGADVISETTSSIIDRLGLVSRHYFLVVARPEPENSIREIVEAYLLQSRSFRLVILGRYEVEANRYHAEIINAAAHSDILFPGSIYDPHQLQELRHHAAAYIHGHQVGGTNPSLVEALAAGNAVLAHNNRFNRWVAGPKAKYFSTQEELAQHFEFVENNPLRVTVMKEASRLRHARLFQWEAVLEAYEDLLLGVPLQEGRWNCDDGYAIEPSQDMRLEA